MRFVCTVVAALMLLPARSFATDVALVRQIMAAALEAAAPVPLEMPTFPILADAHRATSPDAHADAARRVTGEHTQGPAAESEGHADAANKAFQHAAADAARSTQADAAANAGQARAASRRNTNNGQGNGKGNNGNNGKGKGASK